MRIKISSGPNNESVFHRKYDEAVKHVQSRFGKRYPMLINGKSRFESGKSRFEAVPDVDEAIDFIRYYWTELVSNKGPVQGAVTGNTVVLKPPSNTPIVGYLFTRILKKGVLPVGARNGQR